ncbi:hypothetical protein [Hymenobacter lucidus]|uniref:Uncharacterized protein n=1 Tax=Hymenobacter lucidus TaxID=2880930 RepID=A0ABS8AWI0_9BACT|nr:hypothetical protein [Hymenobacter lucidus]MCB2410148.1 hypothetical protein [Hymenobacter lucidus]
MFDEDFLKQLAKDEVRGNFPPFHTGNIKQVEKYVKVIVDRLKDDHQLIVEPDFSYYGSGFASYIPVRISKKDKSDTKALQERNRMTYYTKGLLVYISNLTPYWYYGASEWSVTTENGKVVGGSSGFIRPESIAEVNKELWGEKIDRVKDTFHQYRYNLLTQEELAQQVDFDISVRTVLADKPYEVFDFFFHWSD